ncbi:hypothetical protein ACFL1H_03500 [Nanoarchaeota archaeon]
MVGEEDLFKEICTSLDLKLEFDTDTNSIYGEKDNICASYKKILQDNNIELEVFSFSKDSKILISAYLNNGDPTIYNFQFQVPVNDYQEHLDKIDSKDGLSNVVMKLSENHNLPEPEDDGITYTVLETSLQNLKGLKEFVLDQYQ